MAIFYLDPVNGNDANDGTTFANRWQTFTSGATAARIAPGDTIRVIASPDPTSMGQNATWTANGQSISLTTAVTANIYASGAWTAATTNATITTSTNRKLGTNCVSISPAAAFTTGKAAYLTIANTDFSAYQQVSFSINMTSGAMTADGDITLRLCSDTLGNTTVNTISIPRIRLTSLWQSYTVDLGSALGSSIQSIALYVEQDRGAQTFLVNNVLACKASSASDSLTLTSLISKNTGTDPWMPIYSINGSTIALEFNQQLTQPPVANFGGYTGTTATQTIYKRESLQLPSAIVGNGATNFFGTVNDSGTLGSPIIFSGGWNRTDMSTQTGDSYISGVNNNGRIEFTTISYVTFEKINPTRFSAGFVMLSGCSYLNITAKDISSTATGTSVPGSGTSGNIFGSTFNIDNYTYSNLVESTITVPSSGNTYNIVTLNGNISLTSTAVSSIFNDYIYIQNLSQGTAGSTGTNTQITVNGLINSKIIIDKVTNVYANNFLIIGSTAPCFNNLFSFTTSFTCNTSAGTSTAAKCFTVTSGNNNIIDLNGITLSVIPTSTTTATSSFMRADDGNNNILRNIGGALSIGNTNAFVEINNAGNVIIQNCTAPTLSGTGVVRRMVSPGIGSVSYSNYNNITTDQRQYFISGNTILTDTTTRHTPSGISWKMSPASVGLFDSANANIPLTLPVATIACNASALVTASVWVYRTSTSLITKFVCPGGQILGVLSDVTATASAAINTWEQLTITFTPSQQGVVQLFVNCYGAVADVYVDDFTVSQA